MPARYVTPPALQMLTAALWRVRLTSWAKQNFLAFQAEDGERTGELIAHARTQVEYLCGKYGLPNEEHTSGFWEGAGR